MKSVLVLTERKTRAEIVLKPRDKTTAETVKSLQRLRRYLGRDWKLLFKTITCDNGSEFADQAGIDALGVQTFYCHPRCPSERGTNEINNKLVRRKFPKGQSLRKVTQKQAIAVQQWVNQYTRPPSAVRPRRKCWKPNLINYHCITRKGEAFLRHNLTNETDIRK